MSIMNPILPSPARGIEAEGFPMPYQGPKRVVHSQSFDGSCQRSITTSETSPVPFALHGALNCDQWANMGPLQCAADVADPLRPVPLQAMDGGTSPMVQVCLADEQGPEYYLKLMDAVDVILTRL